MTDYTPLMVKLSNTFPNFSKLDNLDDNEYVYFGSFGSYIIDLMSLYTFSKIETRNYFSYNLEDTFKDKKQLQKEIIAFFDFINNLYENTNLNTKDILNTCIFEAMAAFDFTNKLAKIYFSKKLYKYYSKTFLC